MLRGKDRHRLLAFEAVTRHTLFRQETRWPDRGDHPKLDDQNWHCFTLSRYDHQSGEWAMEKAAGPPTNRLRAGAGILTGLH